MLLSELKVRLQIYLDDRNGDRYTAANLVSLLNAAQEETQKIIDEADEAYFSGVQTYSVVPCDTTLEFELPTDFKKVIIAERIYDDSNPIPANWTSQQRRYTETDIEYPGGPLCYLRGTKIGVVSPVDTYILRVWYTKRISNLSADADVSEIPVEYHDLLCLWSARKGLSAEGRKWPEALNTELEQTIQRLSTHIEARQRQTPARVICKDQW